MGGGKTRGEISTTLSKRLSQTLNYTGKSASLLFPRVNNGRGSVLQIKNFSREGPFGKCTFSCGPRAGLSCVI